MSNQGNLASLMTPAKQQGVMRLSKKAQELIADLVILAVLVGFFVLALGYSPRAQFMPLVISGLSIICMAAEITVRFVLGKEQMLALDDAEIFGTDRMKKEFKRASVASAEKSETEQARKQEARGSEGTILLWLLGLGAMIFVFGFQFSVFAYPVLFLKLGKTKVGWPVAIVTGVLTWASIFVLFSWILNMPFFPGLLFGGEV